MELKFGIILKLSCLCVCELIKPFVVHMHVRVNQFFAHPQGQERKAVQNAFVPFKIKQLHMNVLPLDFAYLKDGLLTRSW
jgi:hypothetical protein